MNDNGVKKSFGTQGTPNMMPKVSKPGYTKSGAITKAYGTKGSLGFSKNPTSIFPKSMKGYITGTPATRK